MSVGAMGYEGAMSTPSAPETVLPPHLEQAPSLDVHEAEPARPDVPERIGPLSPFALMAWEGLMASQVEMFKRIDAEYASSQKRLRAFLDGIGANVPNGYAVMPKSVDGEVFLEVRADIRLPRTAEKAE